VELGRQRSNNDGIAHRRKEGREGGREGGRKEGRKGRKEGRKEGRHIHISKS
jgi:hypothetical protein